MMQATPMQDFQEQTAKVRALSSLTRRDADAVRAAVRAAGSTLVVEEHDDYDGYLSLLLIPADTTEPSFLVSGRTGRMELAALHGDDMTVIGAFAGVGPAMLKLRAVIEAGPWSGAEPQVGAPPPSVATITSLAAALLEQHGSDAAIHAAMRADTSDAWKPVLRAVDVLKTLPPE